MEYCYKEYQPSPELAQAVECYWSFRAGGSYLSVPRRPVIPDGCVDIIWSVDSPDCRCSIVGPMTMPFFSDDESLFGLRFRPFYPSFFVGPSLEELQDIKVCAADLGGSFLREILELSPVIRGASAEESISALEPVILRHARRITADELRGIRGLDLIQSSSTYKNVDEISRETGWSRQHLLRKTRRLTGLSPKFLLQVFRLRKTIENFSCHRDFAHLAAAHGYCDQAHMIRDFKRLTMLRPSEYFSEEMLHLYNS